MDVVPTGLPAPAPAASQPTPPSARYEIVDVTRGFALLGVFVANMIWVARWFALTGEQRNALATAELDRLVSLAALILVDYKFYTIFSMLFGMGFAMQLTRSGRPASMTLQTFGRRMFILLLIGVAHAILLWFGDILHIYALVGLVLILFRNCNDRTLLRWIVTLAILVALLPLVQRALPVVAPEAPDPSRSVEEANYAAMLHGAWSDILALNLKTVWNDYADLSVGFDSAVYWYLSVLWKFLLGFLIGRRMLLQRAEEHLSLFRRALLPLLAIGLIGNVAMGVATWRLQAWIPDMPSIWAALAWIPIDLSMVALSLAYIAGLVLLFQRPRFKAGLRLLSPVGRMALTNYLTQSVAMVLLLYGVGLGLLGKVGVAACVGMCLVIYGLQVAVSALWLNRFRFGPAEWVWRSLTYGSLQPMRQAPRLR